MKNLKNQKGITLVALVVTIIVLLILAGVSLSLVAGSNGIMTRTVNARDKNEAGAAAEAAELAIAEVQMAWYEDYYANGNNSSTNTLKSKLVGAELKTPAGHTIEITETSVEVKKGDVVLAKATIAFTDDNTLTWSKDATKNTDWVLNPAASETP